MNKNEFLVSLDERLGVLPDEDKEKIFDYYSEMIDDRIEEGFSEEEAVSEIGSVDEIISQIVADTSLSKFVKEKIKPKHTFKAWEIILLILGSPIWLSLLITAFAVFISFYVVIWSIIISLWAIEVSLIACAFGGIAAAGVLYLQGYALTGVAILGAGIICAGLSIFLFFGCKLVTQSILLFTKKIALGVKVLFVGKEDTK